MRGRRQTDIVWIAGERSIFYLQRHIAEYFPSHEGLRKFERAVFDQFGIQASICCKVDILEENSIPIRRNFCSRRRYIYSDPKGGGRVFFGFSCH